MDREKALELAEKLLALASSPSQGEANAAVAALHRIMANHDLSMFDVKEKKMREDVIVAEVKHDNWRLHKWVKVLATNMALAFNCKVVMSFYPNPRVVQEPTKPHCRKYVFIGMKTEAEIASFFFDVFHQRLYEIAEREGRSRGYGGRHLLAYMDTFIIGAARVIRERLTQYNHDQMLARVGLKKKGIAQDYPSSEENSPAFNPEVEAKLENEEEDGESEEALMEVDEETFQSMLEAKTKAVEQFIKNEYDEAAPAKFNIVRRGDVRTVPEGALEGLEDGTLAGHSVPIHQGLSQNSTRPVRVKVAGFLGMKRG